MNKTKHNPLISVIMSTYDEPYPVIERSINSIFNQSHPNLELIICIDNPSNLAAKEGLKALHLEQSKKIKLIINEQNIGLGFSLNKCIDESSGEFIARMDADDICPPDRLSKQLQFIMHLPENSVCFTQVEMINSAGGKIKRSFPSDASFEKHFFTHDAFTHATLFTRKNIISKYKYAISHSPEDYDMYFRMFADGCKFHLQNEYLYEYHFDLKSNWRSLAERRKRTQKTSSIMIRLLNKNFFSLLRCHGFKRSYARYFLMYLASSTNILYSISRIVYGLVRKSPLNQ